MAQQLLLSPSEQQLLAAQNVPITQVGLPPELTHRLLQAYLLTPHQVLDLTYNDLTLQLAIEVSAAQTLFATLEAYFCQREDFPWLYPILPPTCFQKPLDVLALSVSDRLALSDRGYARLGQLAVLPVAFSEVIHEALAAYVDTFRRTTVQYQQRIIHIDLPALPGEHLPSGCPLTDLSLSADLLGYLQQLGIKTVHPNLTQAELALVFALTPEWAEALHHALQKSRMQKLSLPPVSRLQPFPPGTDPILAYCDEQMLLAILAQAGYTSLSLQQLPKVVVAFQQLWATPLTELAYFQAYLPEWLQCTHLQTLGELLQALHDVYHDPQIPSPVSPRAPSAALLSLLQQVVSHARSPVPRSRAHRHPFHWFRRLGSST